MAGHMYENGKKIMETFFDEGAEKLMSTDIISSEKQSALGEANLEEVAVFDEVAKIAEKALSGHIASK